MKRKAYNSTWRFYLFHEHYPDSNVVEDSILAQTQFGHNGNIKIITCRKSPHPSFLCHEAIHAVRHVLEKRGMGSMNADNDEAYAYLCDWVFTQLWNNIYGSRIGTADHGNEIVLANTDTQSHV